MALKHRNEILVAVGSMIVGLLLSLLIIIPAASTTGPEASAPDAADVLATAGLAPLPDDAQLVETHAWSGLLGGEQFLAFEASAEAIDRWVAESARLDRDSLIQYTPERPLLEVAPNDPRDNESAEYFVRDPAAPEWFTPAMPKGGRRFKIHADDDGHHFGEVYINDPNRRVLVRVIWS